MSSGRSEHRRGAEQSAAARSWPHERTDGCEEVADGIVDAAGGINR
jgi:hypothetical protein